MVQEPEPTAAPPAPPALKVDEPKVNAENPWGDDVLDRERIARRLSDIVRGQEAPFVISLDGRWGTGKTFLLRRWQQDLENDGWQAIYYNAWEDDFNDDPLLAIVRAALGALQRGSARRDRENRRPRHPQHRRSAPHWSEGRRAHARAPAR